MIAPIPKLIRATRTLNILGAIPPWEAPTGQAIKLVKASSQYLTVGDPTELAITSDLTIQFDVKFSAFPGGGQVAALVMRSDRSVKRCYEVFLYDSSKRLYFDVDFGDGSHADQRNHYYIWGAATLGVWYRIRMSLDASTRTMKLFIDGVLTSWSTGSSSGSGTTINSEAMDVMFGGHPAPSTVGNFADCILDNLLIANTYTATFTESATETPDDTYLANMAGLWLMDEMDGTTLVDAINGNDATAVGSPELVEGFNA